MVSSALQSPHQLATPTPPMLVDGGIDVSAFGDVPAFLFIAVIVTAIVSFIVWGQVENHYAVRQTLVKGVLADGPLP